MNRNQPHQPPPAMAKPTHYAIPPPEAWPADGLAALLRDVEAAPNGCLYCGGSGIHNGDEDGPLCRYCAGTGCGDPLPLPPGWTDAMLDAPVSPTSRAKAMGLGHRPAPPLSLRDAPDTRGRLVIRPDAPRYWEDEARREAWSSATMLALGLLGSIVAGAVVVAWCVLRGMGR